MSIHTIHIPSFKMLLQQELMILISFSCDPLSDDINFTFTWLNDLVILIPGYPLMKLIADQMF